jgi:hypothetical protein
MRAPARLISRHPVLAVLGLAATALALTVPVAQADVWANVGPSSSLAGLKGGWRLWDYDLDEHFSAVSAGVFSGVDVSGLLPMVAYFFGKELWLLTSWLANILIELFGFAFSLDLLNGSGATGGAGALGPVARAIHSIYATVFGGPWMVLGVSVAGIWAMWKALVQRRYAETAGQLALSLAYVAIALLFVWQPAQTIGTASHWTNEMSAAFLSIAKDGEPSSQGEAKEAGADQLFGLLVAQPWAVLEFGGLDHCVAAGSAGEGDEPGSVAVEPLPEASARRLEAGEEVSAGGKVCIDNLKKYGPHFLRFEPGSKEREEEFEALSAGDTSKLPDADPGKKSGTYKLGAADKPAAAAMEKGGQYERLLVAVVVFVAELGAFCLLGALSVGVITAQVLLLLLLAFSPVALIAAVVPGRGHQFFKGWLAKLAGLLLRKAAYSLILAILLAVCAAISAATSELGWLFSFGLQCAFFWAVFLQRRSLTEGLIGMVTGPGSPARDRALDLLALYSGARLVGGATRPARRAARGAGRSALWLGERFIGRGRPGPLGPRRAPIGGTYQRRDLGGGDDAGVEGRRQAERDTASGEVAERAGDGERRDATARDSAGAAPTRRPSKPRPDADPAPRDPEDGPDSGRRPRDERTDDEPAAGDPTRRARERGEDRPRSAPTRPPQGGDRRAAPRPDRPAKADEPDAGRPRPDRPERRPGEDPRSAPGPATPPPSEETHTERPDRDEPEEER